MRGFSEWFIIRRDYLTLVLAVLFSTILMFTNKGRQTETVRLWTLAGFGVILEKFSVLQQLNNIHEENQWLRRKSAELMLENSGLKEAQLENQRLRQLLDFKFESQLDLIAAKVIGKKESGFLNSVVLDAGKAEEIKKNMAVVTAQGLVGKVLQVGKNHSTAELLLDRNFRVSAMVQRSRVSGIIKWIEGENVVLSEVPKRSDVKVDDLVVTSGLSFIFPGGLKVGKVIDVEGEKKGMFIVVTVKPVVDFTKLEEVFVIRDQEFSTQVQ